MELSSRSAASVARDLGVSRAVLSHILTGRNKLSLSVVQHAARVYSDFDLAFVILGTPKVTESQSEQKTRPTKQHATSRISHPATSGVLHATGYDQLILVRDGKFRVLEPEGAEL